MKPRIAMIIALVLITPGLLFTAACSKKTVKSDPYIDQYKEPVKTADQQESGAGSLSTGAGTVSEDTLSESARAKQFSEASEKFENRDIHFEFDSSFLTSEAQAILTDKARFLQKYPDVMVIIEGHCDSRGTNEYNLALGDRRAQSAKAYLINLGIAASRMTTVSYGEEKPLDPRETEEAWAKNRRAHFVLR